MKKQLLITVLTVLFSLNLLAAGATITSFSPSSGTTGTGIFISGSGFTGTTAVKIGGTSAASFMVLNNSTIYAKVPATSSGIVEVTNGTTTSLSGFTYSSGTTPTPTAPTVGNGTLGNPYQIATLQNLYWLSNTTSVWTGGAYFIQTANIDASESSTWTGAFGLIPIGNNSLSFTGHYDGQGFSINNLYINNGAYFVSLFGRVDTGASISNLNLTNETIISASSSFLSGFVAQVNGSSTITNCTVNGGYVYGPGLLGGFVGDIGNATITNCATNLTLFGTSSNTGGFVSYLSSAGIIKGSYCLGSVNGTGYVGGFVGNPAAGSISDCYSRVNVYGSSQINGGFLPYSNSATTTITNCYAVGTVAGTNFTGGFGGYPSALIVFTNCFWDTTVSGMAYGFGNSGSQSGVTGKTTALMTTQPTFTNWDFVGETANGSNDYWSINPANNNGYPYLSWQYFPSAPTITSFTPTNGNVDASVTITGTGFSGVTGLTIGGVAITNYTVNSLSSITFTVPTGAVSGTIAVTNSIGTGTSSETFIVTQAVPTWTGTQWINGTASTTLPAIIEGNYTSSTHLEVGELTIKNNATVVFQSGHNLTINGKLTVETGSTLTMESNANLVQTTNVANSGAISIKRSTAPLKLLDYVLWSSPVAGQQLQSYSPATLSNRFYTYNSGTDLYTAVTTPATDTFAAGTSYLIRMPNDHPTTPTIWTGTFTGIPTNGTVNLAVTNGTYNAIGNPYPSTIVADAFIDANGITEALYFWRKTNNSANPSYATYTKAGGVGTANSADPLGLIPNGVIQVGQGFIAKATSTAIGFTNAMRTANNGNQFLRTKNTGKSRIWLNLTNDSGFFSQALVAYMDGATSGIDAAIDGRYFNDSQTALTSIINNEEFTIQGRALPFDTSDLVPLGFKAETAGDFTLAIDHVDGLFGASQKVFLKDNLTNTVNEISTANYKFSSDAGVFNNRFALVYQKTLGINDADLLSNQILAYKQNDKIKIDAGTQSIAGVKVYDINGRLLAERKNINAKTALIAVNGATQVLLVHISTQEGPIVIKKIIQ